MNKKMFLLLLLFLIPCLSACGKKGNVLTCSKTKFDGYTQDIILKYNSEKTEVIGIDIKAVVRIKKGEKNNLGCLDDSSDEECLEKLVKDAENSCNMSNSLIEHCKVSKKSKAGFTFTAEVIPEKISEFLGDYDTKTPIANMKKTLEEHDEDMICK